MNLDANMYDDDPVETDTTPFIRTNALHLRGVDDMSTGDVHKYLSHYSTDSKPRIEWIDDTSLNLVYYTPSDASIALAHLTKIETDSINHEKTVPALMNPEKPGAELTIRIATRDDKKVRGAKDRSRWYLFHPEDDPDSSPRKHPYARRRSPNNKRKEEDLFAHKKVELSGEDKFSARIEEASRKSLSERIAPRDLFVDRVAKKKDDDLFSHKLKDRIGGPMRIRGTARRRAADLF